MRALLATLLTLPMLALAAPPASKPAGRELNMEERHKKMEQRMRTMFLLGLSEALELNETEALKMADKVRSVEDRRSPLRKTMFESMQTLKKAAEGDASAQGGVDAAAQKILETRIRMAELDRELFNELARGLSAEKKAKLAMYMAHFQHRAGMGKGRMGPGMGPGMGMGPCAGDGPCDGMGPRPGGRGPPAGPGGW